MAKEESTTIRHEIASCDGSSGNSAVTLFAYPDSDETEIVVRCSYIERFNLRDYKKAMRLFDELNGSGRVVDLPLLADIVTHRVNVV